MNSSSQWQWHSNGVLSHQLCAGEVDDGYSLINFATPINGGMVGLTSKYLAVQPDFTAYFKVYLTFQLEFTYLLNLYTHADKNHLWSTSCLSSNQRRSNPF